MPRWGRIAPLVALIGALSPHLSTLRAEPRPLALDAPTRAAFESLRGAPGALPRLLRRGGDTLEPLPAGHSTISVEVTGLTAIVEVRQRFASPSAVTDAIYAFDPPPDAELLDLRIQIGERTVATGMVPLADAEALEPAPYSGPWIDGIGVPIGAMKPGVPIEAVARYAQRVGYSGRDHTLVIPLVSGPRGDDASADRWAGLGPRPAGALDVRVRIDAGAPVTAWSAPGHTLVGGITDGRLDLRSKGEAMAHHDLLLRYTVGGDDLAPTAIVGPSDAGARLVTVVLYPPAPADRPPGPARDVIFVVDTTLSVAPWFDGLIIPFVQRSLRRLGPDDRFDVIAGGTGPLTHAFARLFDAAQPAIPGAGAGVGRWLRRVQAIRPRSRTYRPVSTSPTGRARHLIFVTDGRGSNAGHGRDAIALIRPSSPNRIGGYDTYIRDWAAEGRNRMFGVGVGPSVNVGSLSMAGDTGQGTVALVAEPADLDPALDRVFELIDHPVLTDVTIDWGGLAVRDPHPVPALLPGHPLVIHRWVVGSGRATVTLRGLRTGRPIELPFVVDLDGGQHPARGATWRAARDRADRLAARRIPPDPGPRATVHALAEQHGLATPFTRRIVRDAARGDLPGRAFVLQKPPEAIYGRWPTGEPAQLTDLDGDMLSDDLDRCHEAAEDFDGVADEDGCPETDADGDGILDEADACPGAPESVNGLTDRDGCPDSPLRGGQDFMRPRVERGLTFATGSARLEPSSDAALDRIVSFLDTFDGVERVRIEAHTDSRGSSAANLRISSARAKAVERALVARGVAPERIEARGRGEAEPVADDRTAEGRRLNRRIEMTVVEHHVTIVSMPVLNHTPDGSQRFRTPPREPTTRVERVGGDEADPDWLTTVLADARACHRLTERDWLGAVRLRYAAIVSVVGGKDEHAWLLRCIQQRLGKAGVPPAPVEMTLRFSR